MKLIFEQHAVEEEGKQLERADKYEEALVKYRKAIEYDQKMPKVLRGRPTFFVARVLQKQGKYEEALTVLRSLKESHAGAKHYEDRLLELEVLIEYQKTHDARSVYEYIGNLKENNKGNLPPLGYDGIFGVTVIITLLRLYDTIGDYDAGIKVIDECFVYFKNQDMKKYRKYKPGHVDDEYQKVREAFEQDKRDGTKGRATKALIKSDYFSW